MSVFVFVLNMTLFDQNMKVIVLDITRYVLSRTVFVLNMTGLVPVITGVVLDMTRFIINIFYCSYLNCDWICPEYDWICPK